jgi:hypothetical protein
MEINPAAGPFMDKADPIMGLTISPPTMAVINPAKGGKPLAMAMPKHKGRAIKKTRNPEVASVIQCARSPAKPSFGKRKDIVNKFEIKQYNSLNYKDLIIV